MISGINEKKISENYDGGNISKNSPTTSSQIKLRIVAKRKIYIFIN